MLYCSSLQLVVCLQFPWNQKYFSSVVLRLCGQLFMALWHGFHLFNKERSIGLIPPWRTSPWLTNLSSISATICLLFKIFCQDNKFFFLKSISLFPTSVCPEISQNFCYCNTIYFYCLLKFSTRGTWKEILLILSCGAFLARFSMLEINSI